LISIKTSFTPEGLLQEAQPFFLRHSSILMQHTVEDLKSAFRYDYFHGRSDSGSVAG